MHHPTLSLCMIVRDEANSLARCLDSVSSIVDEMIIVDTGSTDNTPEIARRYGARVEFFTWRDHFADARNESLKYAHGDWVMWLDADEELAEVSKYLLLKLLESRDALGYRVIIDSQQPEHPPTQVLRVIRRDKRLRFGGRIHEGISLYNLIALRKSRWHGGIVDTEILIFHHGYDPDVIAAKGKAARNVRMLERMCADEPDNAVPRVQLLVWQIEEARKSRDVDTAGALCREGLTVADRLQFINDRRNYRALFSKSRVAIYAEQGRFEEALAAAEAAELEFADYAELLFLKGDTLEKAGRLAEAVACYERTISANGCEYLFRTEGLENEARARLEKLRSQTGVDMSNGAGTKR